MSGRPTERASALCPGILARERAAPRLCLTAMVLLLLCRPLPGFCATPAGTVISNTAQVTHAVNGKPALPLNSNTDHFSVTSPAAGNSATMTIAPMAGNLYAGTTHSAAIALINSGNNTLADHRLRVTLPPGVQAGLIGAGVTLISTGAGSSLFQVPALAATASQDYQLSLTLPLAMATNTFQLLVEHLANGVTINTQTIPLTMMNRTASRLETMQYSHGSEAQPVIINVTRYHDAGGNCITMAVPEVPDTPGVPVTAAPLSLEVSDQFSHQQTIFVRVYDPDHNLDSTSADSITITAEDAGNGESETLQLEEAGVDSGTFTGYLTLKHDAPCPHDGHLDVRPQAEVTLLYSDGIDGGDSSVSQILIDPYGEVFDSATGQKLNGYTVRMINADTGLPADVYGDDGDSHYPAAMVSGNSVTDSSGHVYTFGLGQYRFPFAPAGNYRLVVSVPSGGKYRWPSTKSDELLAKLPMSYLAIQLGSRGEIFPLLAGPPLHIDIPVDPLTTQLYLQRSANREQVAAGDFIRYRVSLENTTPVALNRVVLTEVLPHGFRLQQGSGVLDGNHAVEPLIAADGTTLTLEVGTLAAGESKEIGYVVAVGAARPGEASSRSHAIANEGGAESNTAVHTVTVVDELMHDRAVLLGQLIMTGAEGGGNGQKGLAGVRIYLEDGRYAVTDDEGRYHFEEVTPGSHVVQLDLDTIPAGYEVTSMEKNTRFAGRAWSQFVDLQGGTLWRTDFYLTRKSQPTGTLALAISNLPPQEKDVLSYQITLTATTVAVANLRLTVMIPEHSRYQAGSSRFADRPIADPTIVDHKMLTWRLGNSSGDWQKDLHFTIAIDPESRGGELNTKAYALFDTAAQENQRLPVSSHQLTLVGGKEREQEFREELVIAPHYRLGSVTLNEEDKRVLDTIARRLEGVREIHLQAVGHTDNIPLQRPETVRRYGNNHRLSEARAREVAQYLGAILKLPPERMVSAGQGADHPMADNATEQGRLANRRVVLTITGLIAGKEGPVSSGGQSSAPQTVVISAPTPASGQATPASVPAAATGKPYDYDGAWLATQNADIEWVLPVAEDTPAIPSTDIVIKHQAGERVALSHNGKAVPEVNFNGTLAASTGAAVSRWAGVDLAEGDNLFIATITDKGQLVSEIRRNSHYAVVPARAELVPGQSLLIADGKTNPVIAIRILDRDNFPLHAGSDIEYTLNYPFQPARNRELLTDNMPGAPGNRTTATVGDHGIALIRLEPSIITDDLIITLPLAAGQTLELKSRLKAKAREWILVGIAEGSTGFDTVSRNQEGLPGNAADHHLYADDRIAFFAQGRVLGKWLLTMAYDGDKERSKRDGHDPRLFHAIDPGRYYTVYGDAGQNGVGAPSSDRIYVKLERDEFYFLYGDYETGLKGSTLTRYERTLTGIKSRYQDGRFDLICFVSENNQTFVKDEFRGQGSTGPYQLSRRDVAMNSEKVTLERRDRYRGEVIVGSRELARYSDYDINYTAGTITFREPVFSTDPELNPQYIIVRYEAYGTPDTRLTAGGRAEVRATDKLTLGVTQVSEGGSDGNGLLGGADLRYRHSDHLTLRLEAGRSRDHQERATPAAGNAYLAEMEYQTTNSSSKFSFHDTDPRFGLGQTNLSEIGLRKSSLETLVRLWPNLHLKGQLYRLENSTLNASRTLGEAQGELTVGATTLRAGLRQVRDELDADREQRSDQITAGISQALFAGRVILRADQESNLNQGDHSLDFPDLTRIGVDYHLTDRTTLYAEQEFRNGSLLDSRSSRLGIKATPWNGGEIYSGLTRASGTLGDSTSANLAAHQRWQLTKAWSVDVGGEESKVLSRDPGLPVAISSSFANSGSGFYPLNAWDLNEEFSAASLGVTYTHQDWLWTTRGEARLGDSSDRRNFASSVQTSPRNNLSLLAAINHSESDQHSGEEQGFSNLLLGLAYRPRQSRWLILDKLELVTEEFTSSNRQDLSRRLINLLNVNYKAGASQTSFQYGAKTATETIDGGKYSQFVDLIGIETRYDLTERWDLGLQATTLHAWTLNHYDTSCGISIGHTIADNIWISLGYNFTGFFDEDFSRGNYTRQGGFIKFRMKFDQQSIREGLEWLKK